MSAAKAGGVSSNTMITLDFREDGDVTLLTLVGQSGYLGEGETADMRSGGWALVLDKLERLLAEIFDQPEVENQDG